MNIVYLSASIIPSKNANSIHVMKMCQAFAKNGHNVTLFARESSENVDDVYSYYGVEKIFKIEKIVWPNIRGLGGWVYGKRIKRKIMNNNRPDLFYGRDIYSILEMTSMPNSEIYYEAHTPPANKIRKIMEKRLFNSDKFKRLIVISEALKEEYLSIFPNLSNKILVAHDAADSPSGFLNVKVENFNSNTFKVGYIGHLYPGKGMEVITKLAYLLPDIEFHIVGGKEKDINYWRNKIKTKNLVFHGFIPHGLLNEYYNQFDIVLAPYQTTVTSSGGKGDISKWMSPLKIFEYMAYGKAIIASDLPVLKEVLIHNKNCILCPPKDIDAWVKAILKLKEDKDLKFRIGKQAREIFLQKYTWEQRGRNVLA